MRIGTNYSKTDAKFFFYQFIYKYFCLRISFHIVYCFCLSIFMVYLF